MVPVAALHLAMVVVPPLLTGLIRHCVGTRIAEIAVTEVADLHHAAARLRDTGADVRLSLAHAPAEDATLIRRVRPRRRPTSSPPISRRACSTSIPARP